MQDGDIYFRVFVRSVDSANERTSVGQFENLVGRYFVHTDGRCVQRDTHADLSSFIPSYPILVYAATYGRCDLIQLLVEKFGCDVNVMATPSSRTKLHSMRTALHVAVLCGHTNTVATLLRLGADPNIEDGGGMTPLDLLQSSIPLNSLGQVCSYDELQRWDRLEFNVEERRRDGRLDRSNPAFNQQQREQMENLLQLEQTFNGEAATSPRLNEQDDTTSSTSASAQA